MKAILLALSILTMSLPALADQVMSRELHCRIVSYSNVPNSIIVNAQAYYDLAPIRFVRKGTAVLADAKSEFRYLDANNKLLAIVGISAFLHQDQKVAGLSLSLNDARDYVMSSAAGELRLNGSSQSVFAKMPVKIPAVLFGKDTTSFKSEHTINVEMTGLTALCTLEKSR